MNLDAHFPRYTESDPTVPVWCLTPDTPGCIHRFFDTNPISPSGRYLAVFQLPFEDRLPGPGDTGKIVVVDLETGAARNVADTRGWETQLGANLNWGGSDEELFFNDVDTTDWTPFAWRLNPLTGESTRLGGTLYHASPDGRWLVSSNLKQTARTQPGYGVCVPRDGMQRNRGLPDNDGFWLTDTQSGEARLVASLRTLVEAAGPALQHHDPERDEIYGFHSKFNPRGDRLMVSLRWFEAYEEPTWHAFNGRHGDVRFAWFTLKPDGSDIRLAIGPEHWLRGGHHATFMPDGDRISMNLNDGEELRFAICHYDGSDLHYLEGLKGSGHPTITPDDRHLITDCYQHETAFVGEDGRVPLRWIDLTSRQESAPVRINTRQERKHDSALRVDPHPAWDRTNRYVVFNGYVDGTRRVFLADMAELL